MKTLYDKLQSIDTRGKNIFQLAREVNEMLSPIDKIPVHKPKEDNTSGS